MRFLLKPSTKGWQGSWCYLAFFCFLPNPENIEHHAVLFRVYGDMHQSLGQPYVNITEIS
jgi:hypothetical protein